MELIKLKNYSNAEINALYEKRETRLQERELALDVQINDIAIDNSYNTHIMAYRESDESFIVWSMYNNGIGDRTTYEGFYNGKYDLSENEAFSEMMKRVEKNNEN